MTFFTRDKTFAQPVNLTITLSLALFHVGAIVALFMFSWKALVFGLFMCREPRHWHRIPSVAYAPRL